MVSAIDPILSRITFGHLTVLEESGEKHEFGTQGSSPHGTMIIRNPAFYGRVARDGSLGLGESYMEGWWDAENNDLASIIGILLANDLGTMHPVLQATARFFRMRRPLSRVRASDNIRRHYDIGNDFYALFLDENMGYTCGYQVKPGDTIEQMQDQKHERVCRKLALKPGERIADLGCGFGAMLRYAAKHYGISGIGYTLSVAQAEWANHTIKEEGLSDRISVALKDYRDAEGSFDKVVSIGMTEHVCEHGYDRLMAKISSLMPEGGVGLVHTIGSTWHDACETDPWIKQYIFPGGRLPRLHELAGAMQQAGLTIGHAENFKPHYARTLRLWKEKFDRNSEQIRKLGPRYNTAFLRMWDYYLQSCEGGFRFGALQLYQLLFCKGKYWTLPMQMEFAEK